jgi:glycine/D-amino acid oxidase-like deaminating enzyme
VPADATRRGTGDIFSCQHTQFSTGLAIRLSLYSLDFFACFEEATSYPFGHCPQGYLYMASDEEHLAGLQNNHKLLVACGAKSVGLVSLVDVLRLAPQLRADGIGAVSASYS